MRASNALSELAGRRIINAELKQWGSYEPTALSLLLDDGTTLLVAASSVMYDQYLHMECLTLSRGPSAGETPEGAEEVDALLRGSYNALGIRRWWQRPRKQLGERSPLAVWQAGENETVIELASRMGI